MANTRQDATESSQLLEKNDDVVIPINTAGILRKLEKKNKKLLADSIEHFRLINCREKAKYGLPAVGVAVGAGSVAAFIYFLTQYVKLPNLKEAYYQSLGKPDFALKYANTLIEQINATCGTTFSLKDVCDFSAYVKPDDLYCFNLANAMNNTQVFFNSIAGYNNDIVANSTCASLYPVASFCNWHAIAGYAHECFNYARYLFTTTDDCDSPALLAKYLNSTLAEIARCDGVPALNNVTCGELLPLQNLCADWKKYLATAAYQCAEKAIDVCAHATMRQNDIDQFNNAIPGFNYSCAVKYPNNTVLADQKFTCFASAQNICSEQNAWNDQHQYAGSNFEWMSEGRFFTLVGVITGLGTLLCLVGCLLYKGTGTAYLKQKHTVGELPPSDQGMLKSTVTVFTSTQLPVQTPLSIVVDQLEGFQDQLPVDKALLNEMRHAFLIGRKDPDSTIPPDLPREIAQTIFYFADLWRVYPTKLDENLMIDEDEKAMSKKCCAIL